MKYKASLDLFATIVTYGLILFCAAEALIHFKYNESGDNDMHGIVFLLLAAVLCIGFLFAPRHYILTDSQLVIVRPIGNKVINLSSIIGAKTIDNSDFIKLQRTIGSGGLFGYYGNFSGINVYATQKKKGILFTTSNNKEYLISPDDISLCEKLGPRNL